MCKIRVGVVRYLNARPLIEGLETCQDLELTSAVPSRIAPLLIRGDLDIGLVSVIDFAHSPVSLTMIPAGMIGCSGPTLTVRVFSRVPPAEIRSLAADTDSHTSVVLAQLILQKVHNTKPKILDYHAREMAVESVDAEDWPESVLLIGDKVVTACPPEHLYPHQIDLGQAWHDLTGLPFVYALWMCRTQDAHRPEICQVASLLDRQQRRNAHRLDWIVSNNAADRRWPDDLAREYIGHRLRFAVGEQEIESICRFLSLASESELAPRVEPRFFSAVPDAISASGT